MSLDEEVRREVRLAAAGVPSLRRLVELGRLATAIAEHGRRQPPIALFQLPVGTTNVGAALRSCRYVLRGQWEWNGPVEPGSFLDQVLRAGAISAQVEHFSFRQRGLERFKPDEPLRPTFELRPADSLSGRHILRALWRVGAELEVSGIFPSETVIPMPNVMNVAYIESRSYVSDFDGPVILSFTVLSGPESP